MKKLIFITILAVAMASCEDKPLIVETGNTFSFTSREMFVNVTDNTCEIELMGTREYNDIEQWYPLEVIENETTAIVGEQVTLPSSFQFHFKDDTKTSSVKIGVNSETIRKEVVLTLTRKHKPKDVDYSKYIDTIKVFLKPEL